MRVSDIRVTVQDEYCELSANVKFDTHWVWGDEPFPLWYRFPKEYESYLNDQNGDPFLAAFLAPAMALGEPLEIEAPVTAKLLHNVSEIQTIYRCWDKTLSEVTIQAPQRSRPPAAISAGQNIGLFFSLGVDSSYSLLKNVNRHAQDSETISHLIIIEGCDIYLWESGRFQPLLTNIHNVGQELDKQVISVTTNLRDVSDRIVDWVRLYYGSALASIALALDGMFRKVHIAAAQTYSKLVPGGAHPLLDPLWSTEVLSFIHDGLEAERLDKIKYVAQCPVLVDNLRVCITDEVIEEYNCGRCEKCLRTMIGLHIAGVLQNSQTLPHEIDTELIRGLTVSNPVARGYIRSLIEALGNSEQDITIKSALEECLG